MPVSLPLESESVRCSHFALRNGIDPGGTGLAPDVIVLVEVDEPWPKPVAKHDALVELARAAQGRPEQIRLLAAVPMADEPRRVIALRPTPTGMTRSERLLCADPVGAFNDALEDDAAEVLENENGNQTLLVCTQGSHDLCCGTEGLALAEWVEAELGVEVFRVSHTGGHRFAPTAMTLPNGRMWAYLSPETTRLALDRSDASLLAAQCRGWWGAPTGPAQIAERAVLAELGFSIDTEARTVESVEADGRHDVVVTVGDAEYVVVVERGREVPTIACESPGGVPVKPGVEWAIRSGPTKRS